MPATKTAPEPENAVETAPPVECWFEVYLVPIREAIKAAQPKAPHPERLFSSKDPRWDELKHHPQSARIRGSLIVGRCQRIGNSERIDEETLETFAVLGLPWEKARAKQIEWEKNPRWRENTRLWNTPKADAVHEEQEARKAGNRELADAIAAALKRDTAGMVTSEGRR